MGDVIAFVTDDDFNHVSYIDDKGDLGVSTKCKSISIYRLNKTEFEVACEGVSFILNRELAIATPSG